MEDNCIIRAPFLMDMLRICNEEERQALCGTRPSQRERYTSDAMDTIDYAQLPHGDWTVSVVRHPRFESIPRHRHNFIEAMHVRVQRFHYPHHQ